MAVIAAVADCSVGGAGGGSLNRTRVHSGRATARPCAVLRQNLQTCIGHVSADTPRQPLHSASAAEFKLDQRQLTTVGSRIVAGADLGLDVHHATGGVRHWLVRAAERLHHF